MNEREGIRNTKEMMILGLQLAMAGKTAYADKKLSVGDLALVMSVFPSIGPAIEGMKEIPAELKDLSEAEGLELLATASTFLPAITDNARLGAIVIKSIKLALAIGELTAELLKKEEVAEPTPPVAAPSVVKPTVETLE